jgi:adenine-specific DNA-methyltransferase
MNKINTVGVALENFLSVKPYRGLLTGLNAAFIIDNDLRQSLIDRDSKSERLIKRFLRGQDVKRWQAEWKDDLWQLLKKS